MRHLTLVASNLSIKPEIFKISTVPQAFHDSAACLSRKIEAMLEDGDISNVGANRLIGAWAKDQQETLAALQAKLDAIGRAGEAVLDLYDTARGVK